jgi:ribonuclease H2 subunit C
MAAAAAALAEETMVSSSSVSPIECSANTLLDLPSASLHLLPVQLSLNGPAPVSTYFIPVTNSNGVLEATFRGRELKGRLVVLPAGVLGLVMRKQVREKEKETEENTPWKIVSKFGTFHYWNREITPSEVDRPSLWLRWLPLARAIHSPLSLDDLVTFSSSSSSSELDHSVSSVSKRPADDAADTPVAKKIKPSS